VELYTIGYEGLHRREFLARLQRYGISVVADVRRVPLSRKKGFSKNGLSVFLSEQNIAYISFRDLGTSSEMRDELKTTGNYEAFFKRYRSSLVQHDDQLDRILTMVKSGEIVSLLCFENDPGKCHRMIIAEEVKKRNGNGLRIRHVGHCD
jgi:uncharacterized protein (DUF488 family)